MKENSHNNKEISYMRDILSKFRTRLAAMILVSLVFAGLSGTAAYAYWTTTGSGTGNAATASANGTLVLHANFTAGLTPDGSKVVTITADNAGTTDLRVNTVHPVVSVSNAYDAGTNPTGCKATWFSIGDLDASGVNVAAGASGVSLGTKTLTFTDSATENQDGCKLATVTVTLSTL